MSAPDIIEDTFIAEGFFEESGDFFEGQRRRLIAVPVERRLLAVPAERRLMVVHAERRLLPVSAGKD